MLSPRVKMKLRFFRILMAETFSKVSLESVFPSRSWEYILAKIKNIDWSVFLECDDVITFQKNGPINVQMTSSLLFTKLI